MSENLGSMIRSRRAATLVGHLYSISSHDFQGIGVAFRVNFVTVNVGCLPSNVPDHFSTSVKHHVGILGEFLLFALDA